MEVKKYNPFVVIKPTGSTRERSWKPKTELEAKGLTLDNKKKQNTIYAKGFVKTSKKEFDYH